MRTVFKQTLIVLSLMGAILMQGCSYGDLKQFTSRGDAVHVVCFSGGQPVFVGNASGKVSQTWSGMWYYADTVYGLVMLTGDCVISERPISLR